MAKILRYIFLFSFSIAQGQESKHSCSFLADSLWVGKPCTLRVSIQVKPGSFLEVQDGLTDFYPYQLMDVFAQDPIRNEGMDWYVYEYVLRSFAIGDSQHVTLNYIVTGDTDTSFHVLFCEGMPFASVLSTGKDSLLSGFQYQKELISVEDAIDYRDTFVWGILLIFGAFVGYFVFRKLWVRLIHWGSLWLQWRELKRAWNENLSTMPVPASFISSLNYLWKNYLDPDRSFYLVSLTYEELAKKLASIPTLSEVDLDVLMESVQMENDIVYAEKKVPQDELEYMWKAIFPILKRAYDHRRKRIQKDMLA